MIALIFNTPKPMISISVQLLFSETQTQTDISLLPQGFCTEAKVAKLHAGSLGCAWDKMTLKKYNSIKKNRQ